MKALNVLFRMIDVFWHGEGKRGLLVKISKGSRLREVYKVANMEKTYGLVR